MEFKGTKGKWKLENIDNNWLVMSNDENLVGINNNKANALLISKAPEMLAMLEKSKASFEWISKNCLLPIIKNQADADLQIEHIQFNIQEIEKLIKKVKDNGKCN